MRLSRAQARARNREALIAAAVAEMGAAGYAAARLEDIAERAEVTTGAIYSIFGSKSALLAAVLEQLNAEFFDATADLENPELSLTQVLSGIGVAWFRAATAPLAREQFAFEAELLATALRDPSVSALLDETTGEAGHARLARLLTDRATTDDPAAPRTTDDQAQHLALVITGAVTGLAQQVQLVPDTLTEDDFVRSTLALGSLLR
ncbi:TetR family transcriptional regulator [Nocardia fluminea]|uniref:TetR family transcriptional regulator n=1 Tax=Nocardia fluminea TaxID=134984 RepID=UPI00365F8637